MKMRAKVVLLQYISFLKRSHRLGRYFKMPLKTHIAGSVDTIMIKNDGNHHRHSIDDS